MLGTLLSLFRKLYAYRDQQKTHAWNNLGTVNKVNGSTVLVIGMGDIGGSFARLVKAMGAYVIGVRRTDATKPDYVDEIHLTEELEDLLPRADVVAMSLPGNAQTTNILSRERIAMMKDGAVVINVGRGTAIDTEALCDALESGHLGGAALDVTNPEPLPADHRMWDIPNVIITPHVSGGWSLPETFERIVRLSADNLRRYFNGEPLKNVIDRETRYRKL
jgi:phosphoglycerate dehydrogenase-like enzyme